MEPYDIEERHEDLFQDTPRFQQAAWGKRLANLFIDRIAFMGFLFLIGILLGLVYPPSAETFRSIADNRIVDLLLTSLLYAVYMGAQEALFNGKTLGKLITKTRAVFEDGSSITASAAFTRGICRVVPFEPFSALGNPTYPWHDRWSHTVVVDEGETTWA
ncbi:MAG: RDD family protein [Chitinophagaceae bacterium]|nr:MAG: RDD family protein [Chitinophagaceae bacterium]